MNNHHTGHAIRIMEEHILALLEGDQAKETLSFKYVCPESDRSGWYFWPKKKDGVYHLKIQGAYSDSEKVKAIINLYYYPHPQEEDFSGFSCLEQFIRVSEIFYPAENISGENMQADNMQEGIGIPLPSYQARLQPWLYRIGDLILFLQGGRIKNGVLEASVLSQTWSTTDIKMPDKNGNEHILLKSRSLDRCLRSWDLACFFCHGFLDNLINLAISYSSWVEKTNGPEEMQKLYFKLDYKV